MKRSRESRTPPILHYKLACHDCQLRDMEVAKARLTHAFNLDPGFRAKALDEKDFEPLLDP